MTTPLPQGCKARRQSDQMYCPHCGLLWDINDPEPPECRRALEVEVKFKEKEE